jgi:hypothetical protein
MDQHFLLTILSGCLGAIAPRILSLYNLQFEVGSFRHIPRFHFVITVLYAALGGFVAAVVLGAGNYGQAFYDGVALPTFIATAMKSRPPKLRNIVKASEPQARKRSLLKLLRDDSDALFD